MKNTQNVLVLLVTAALVVSPAIAFNITRLLDQHPEFSSFNSLLTQTGVASAINSRKTITVLALDNSECGRINGLSGEVLKEVVALHVALSYYDNDELDKLSKNGSALMTTLYQTTGKANGGQGFVNVTVSQGQVRFGSAVHGAQHDSQLIKVVAAQPYNISVLQVSNPIMPPGLAQLGPGAAPAPRKMGPPPRSSHHSAQPSASPSDADSPADAAAADTPAPSHSKAPKGSKDDADAPADDPAADDESAAKKKKSAGSRVATSSGLLLVVAALAAVVAL